MTVRIIYGDCREVLLTLPPDSFDCIVTSPPYWGLRDYGVAGQIGLEATLAEYLATMVGVFRELRRVLKPSGTCWLNIGDSYAGSWGAQSREHAGKHAPNVSALSANQVKAAQNRVGTGSLSRTGALKAKDLCMVPNRLAILLQDDGWWVRSEIIWHKPNPMPESVTDRPTCSHEKVWMLTKSAKYFYDADAVRKPGVGREDDEHGIYGRLRHPRKVGGVDKQRGHSRRHAGFDDRWDKMERSHQVANGANARNVWTIASEPYRGAHYAVMPSALAERCILAGSPRGGSVLDPFGGAGTTGLAADRLRRHATLIELNPTSREMAADRIKMDGPLFADIIV